MLEIKYTYIDTTYEANDRYKGISHLKVILQSLLCNYANERVSFTGVLIENNTGLRFLVRLDRTQPNNANVRRSPRTKAMKNIAQKRL